VNAIEDTPVETPKVVAEVRALTPGEASRNHLDLVEAVQTGIPGLVAVTIIISYLLQVWHTGNTDSALGTAMPIIVAAYFIQHTATSVKRRG